MAKKQTPPTIELPADNEFRQRILRELDTTMLVEAAAGTGKTTSMVGRMVALLREGKCRIDTLAAVTFTRKSAAELRARFQVELERAAHDESGPASQRLSEALQHVERCFIGTIHSFCARLLRERPMEAGVDINFTELEEADDLIQRESACDEYVTRLYAENSPLLAELSDLGLEVGQLKPAFLDFAQYPDVDEWPALAVELPDLGPLMGRIDEYVQHMETLAPTFPADRGNDKLMNAYERIPRLARQVDRARQADVMSLVAEFRSVGVVQKEWPGGAKQGKAESMRWETFIADNDTVVLQELWLQRRYATVMRILPLAIEVYAQRHQEAGGLNFQDLLMRAAKLLRANPTIRHYFRSRFTHLLVDEFQDTDPIQAEVMLLLTADDAHEPSWRKCRPVPGALFVVGDPKQSIYRFRRADIVTYTKVKEIIDEAGGAVVPLTTNFRTTAELVNWGNQVFDNVFPAVANTWSPAPRPMDVGRLHEGAGELRGLHLLRVPETHTNNDQAVEYESDFIARTIRRALDAGLTVPRTPRELERGASPKVQPGDFLLVMRLKKHLALYARKLGELGIPHQVTGGSALGQVSELALLAKCLTAATEPENPVALVAVLRGELFGASDADLYAFRQAGGRFDFRAELPEGLAAEHAAVLQDAFARLKRYGQWLRRLPPVAAIERIAADLGLPMRAAAAVGGNVRAGSLAKAFEMLRTAQAELNSTADLAQHLQQLLDDNCEFDGLPAHPHDAPAVRVMNLHQVKGLEAPIVFLCDPTGNSKHDVELHIDRSGDLVKGYLAICGSSSGWSAPTLAKPVDWERLASDESKFQEAEKQRLMYVAATRAGAQMVIVQREKKDGSNPWSFFAEYLTDCPTLAEPGPQVAPVGAKVMVAPQDVTAAVDDIGRRWDESAKPSYATAAAKALSLAPSKLHFHATTGEHGTEWGTVIHLLLETALARPDVDLHQLARLTLVEEGLDISEAENAVQLVLRVLGSKILRRAKAASRHLVEIPFQKLIPASAPNAVGGLPTVLRGVIDLAFFEPAGWVIVDYKTDRIETGQLPATIDRYRAQVGTYADAWHEMLGQPVHERGLYFTHVDSYVKL
jgi:ATP-dependent helicase/nuclease subunit A